jgi:hypothetical protein
MNGAWRPTYDQGMRAFRIVLAVFALSAFVWVPAAAAKQYAPPGKAGTSEYAEDIPTAGGNVSTPAMGGGNRTAAQIDKLGAGKAGVRKLTKLGTTGAATAQFAQQTAPVVSRATALTDTTGSGNASTSNAGTGTSGRSARGSTLAASGKSALSGVWGTISGADVDGIGAFLPLLLAFGLGAAVAVMVLRLRRDEQPSV